ILHEVEQQWARPTGARRWLQSILVMLADWVPPLALLAALAELLWRYFDPREKGYPISSFDIVLPAVVVLAVLVILHLLISLRLPSRWGAIRSSFKRLLERRPQGELEATYLPVPADVTQALLMDRKRVQALLGETREVAEWLEG